MNNEVKVEIKKLFQEIMDDWLLQIDYFIEVGSMDPLQAEQKALQKYRRWAKQLETLLEEDERPLLWRAFLIHHVQHKNNCRQNQQAGQSHVEVEAVFIQEMMDPLFDPSIEIGLFLFADHDKIVASFAVNSWKCIFLFLRPAPAGKPPAGKKI